MATPNQLTFYPGSVRDVPILEADKPDVEPGFCEDCACSESAQVQRVEVLAGDTAVAAVAEMQVDQLHISMALLGQN